MRRAKLTCFSILVLGLAGVAAGASASPAGPRVVHYQGVAIRVPAGWPVYRLSRNSRVCVRFDRHAVYLGAPGSQEDCPAAALGHTEAVLVEPARAAGAGTGFGADATTFHRHDLAITATWLRHPGVVRWALGLRSLKSGGGWAGPAVAPTGQISQSSQVVPAVFTGQGFDACAAPSKSTMAAWHHSSLRAIGVYIGGRNRACAQPNLTRQWVSAEAAAGWHLIAIYAGLQAPVNRCGCKGITPGQAKAEGAASAADAVRHAAALGIGPGNAIYFDMEGYSKTKTNRKAVLAFLAGWTKALHASGYMSGVHGSLHAGIRVLTSQWGSSYPEPDDLLYSAWDGKNTTQTKGLPKWMWEHQQRIHQYLGPHNVDIRGHTLNIDSDDVNALTAASSSSP